jgi:hypothetical protein
LLTFACLPIHIYTITHTRAYGNILWHYKPYWPFHLANRQTHIHTQRTHTHTHTHTHIQTQTHTHTHTHTHTNKQTNKQTNTHTLLSWREFPARGLLSPTDGAAMVCYGLRQRRGTSFIPFMQRFRFCDSWHSRLSRCEIA